MVVMDELPFSMVEGKGFKRICESLNPHFQVPYCRTLVRHFMVMYEEMKQKLKGELASHRVCLTTDTWTSVQNINYMVITTHFIDGEWNLHKRILNFCVIANHKGNSIGKLLETCLLHWDLNKIFKITANNASSNTKAIDYLKSKMGHWKNGSLVLEGKYMHVRCCAHIVNLIVRDGLKKLEKSILAIRNVVRYVRSSPQRLKVFYDMTLKMSVSLHPASHTTFHNLIAIEGEIGDLFFGEQLPSETHTSTVLKDMTCSMKVKFEKYWGDLDKVNQLLIVALVLDPRYKLGNLEFVLKRRFENPQDATKKKNEVKELLMKLYEEYAIPPPPTQCTSAKGDTSSTSSITITSSSKKGGGKHLWEMEEG
ncbi:unnamed protein product [Prunus brigantina]